MDNLNLTFNSDKSVFMTFNSKTKFLRDPEPDLFLNNCRLRMVNSYKYLGIIFSSNLRNKLDIEKCELAFLRQFHCLYRKFHFTSPMIFNFLFKSHCLSFYGAELWDCLYGCSCAFHSLGVNYHKAIKKFMKAPWRRSNHSVCEEADIPIFKHFISAKMITFAFSLLSLNSPCFLPFKSYFKSSSFFIMNVKKHFETTYNIPDVFNNDIDAVKARINFVSKREKRSGSV